MSEDFEPIAPVFNAHKPAPEDDVRALQARYPGLPTPYLDFLRKNDGGNGRLPSGRYIRFWRAAEIAPLNGAYEVPRYAPGFLLFGSDGGDEAYAFDTRENPWIVGRLPFVGMSDAAFFEKIGTFERSLDELGLPAASSAADQVEAETFIVHLKPIILGGHPTDRANMRRIDRDQNISFVRYWNDVVEKVRASSTAR